MNTSIGEWIMGLPVIILTILAFLCLIAFGLFIAGGFLFGTGYSFYKVNSFFRNHIFGRAIGRPLAFIVLFPYILCVWLYNKIRPEYDQIGIPTILRKQSTYMNNKTDTYNSNENGNWDHNKIESTKHEIVGDVSSNNPNFIIEQYYADYETVETQMSIDNVVPLLNETYAEGEEKVYLALVQDENNDSSLYLLANTVDLTENDGQGDIYDEDYLNGFHISMTFDDVQQPQMDIKVSDYQHTLTYFGLMYEVTRLPVSRIKKVRRLSQEEEAYTLAQNLIHGKPAEEDKMWYLMPYEFFWKSATENYVFKKKYYQQCLDEAILTQDEAAILFKRLSRMNAKGEEIFMMVDHQFNGLFYVLSNMEDLEPKPFMETQDLIREPIVKDYLKGDIDSQTLIHVLNQKGYPADMMFGGWLEWSM
ncbi:hypothetical protein ACTWQB_16970 [Piscibacillus sp. B03]|uniref:hypothetical protein n=1 Tax=Piscibacillus sp. B03 TaxID=3457430 RepID=UPI003FCDAFF5